MSPPDHENLPSTPSPSQAPASEDLIKRANHFAALGWIFALIGILSSPVLPIYGFYYGWQAYKGGEINQGIVIMAIAALTLTMTLVLFIKSMS